MILIHPSIDPVILSLGIVQIRWYSLAYIIGFILGIYVLKKINNTKIFNLDDETILMEFEDKVLNG